MNPKPILLVAEDDPDDQFLIEGALKKFCPPNVETRFLENGEELMHTLHEKLAHAICPDLVLMDLNMPCKDGRWALQEIKADSRLADIPVVVLTTSENEQDVQYCRRYGVAAYYTKPGSIIELRKIIQSLCNCYLT